MAEKWSTLIAEFINVTGVNRDRAKSLLDATNGNLEMAIEMHFDSCTTENQASSSLVQDGAIESSASSSRSDLHPNMEDNVRAPIPQTRGILVEEPYSSFSNRKRTSRSVFDAFRDFQAEARQQELEAAGEAGASKRKTLEDLFRPPIDLLHKGTFETAKTSGQQQSKWLLVNVQDVKEFRCQQLNRDVWSNEQVRKMIREHFVLWQVYKDTDEGERFIQFYHVSSFPYLAVVDPRTGEKLMNWGFMDASAFCENATEFIFNHSGLKEETPPAKRKKRESIVDASEDSQLEAAIAASLRYSTSTVNDNGSRDGDGNDGDDDDDDDLRFSDSEDDEETWKPQKISKGKTTINTLMNNKNPKDSTASTSSSNASKDNVENEKNSHTSSSLGGVVTCKSDTGNTNEAEEASTGVSSTSSSTVSSTISSSYNMECYNKWKKETDEMCKIMLRFPNGGRKQVSLSAEAPLLALVQFVQSEGYPNEKFEMLTNFPRKKLSYLDFTVTLKEAGLYPHETVFVQER
ncbi:UBX domain-containing protein 7-like isoform X2 [Actinia tenebrosa]|uniref:UBX domain-containing protein 7-like isoform X2 n=1 Tax=Actinia tenebrosa TaxID=6105 RepID=A0A6P8H043_ACTTE|nr:UBX domain-containing protein 7-like isoform X2 [Actinia tenebrosa]